MKRDLSNLPHVVYRAYDATGRLLYVGCTVNLDSRLKGHAISHWWPRFAARVATETHPDFASGRAAEEAAIREERPVANVQCPGRTWTESWALQNDYFNSLELTA